MLQLDGGNDGINTVVPFGDVPMPEYRRQLLLPAEKLFKLGDGIGLHPAMKPAASLFESGRLAIVQGVGYPNPNRSHFESMAIWQTARPANLARAKGAGWAGHSISNGRRARSRTRFTLAIAACRRPCSRVGP